MRSVIKNILARLQLTDAPLFGHLVDPNYVAPETDGWLNEDDEIPPLTDDETDADVPFAPAIPGLARRCDMPPVVCMHHDIPRFEVVLLLAHHLQHNTRIIPHRKMAFVVASSSFGWRKKSVARNHVSPYVKGVVNKLIDEFIDFDPTQEGIL
ncbi:hypothetical protein QVD17_24129 [Tagetes erecta]|uniref:Uncharacterized protein n=1 Tax=Tagetes erecta TaxID=13708 RepID=A0AAD8KEU6_TARER|nr:hypothetical protein QVD17_24129 [Tagetes erecta]